MTKEEFETSLRQYLNRKPFRPFVVQLLDGRQVLVKKPPVVFADGAASFIDPEEEALVEFFHDETKSFGLQREVSL